MPASVHHSAISSWSLTGCSAARSWHSLGSASCRTAPSAAGGSPPRLGCGGYRRRGLPALVPDRPGAEHREELRLLRRGIRIGEAGLEAEAFEWLLGVAVDDIGQFEAEAFVEGRHDVDRVVVLAADLAGGGDPGRPGDDQRVGGAALVVRVALPQLEGRIEGPGPAGRVVVVGSRAAELVEVLEVLLHRVGQAVEELVLVDGPVRPALAGGAVVGDEHDDRVVDLAAVLEVVEQASQLVVGVAEEACVDLGHPTE